LEGYSSLVIKSILLGLRTVIVVQKVPIPLATSARRVLRVVDALRVVELAPEVSTAHLRVVILRIVVNLVVARSHELLKPSVMA
jgi:hypothetical protein